MHLPCLEIGLDLWADGFSVVFKFNFYLLMSKFNLVECISWPDDWKCFRATLLLYLWLSLSLAGLEELFLWCYEEWLVCRKCLSHIFMARSCQPSVADALSATSKAAVTAYIWLFLACKWLLSSWFIIGNTNTCNILAYIISLHTCNVISTTTNETKLRIHTRYEIHTLVIFVASDWL